MKKFFEFYRRHRAVFSFFLTIFYCGFFIYKAVCIFLYDPSIGSVVTVLGGLPFFAGYFLSDSIHNSLSTEASAND